MFSTLSSTQAAAQLRFPTFAMSQQTGTHRGVGEDQYAVQSRNFKESLLAKLRAEALAHKEGGAMAVFLDKEPLQHQGGHVGFFQGELCVFNSIDKLPGFLTAKTIVGEDLAALCNNSFPVCPTTRKGAQPTLPNIETCAVAVTTEPEAKRRVKTVRGLFVGSMVCFLGPAAMLLFPPVEKFAALTVGVTLAFSTRELLMRNVESLKPLRAFLLPAAWVTHLFCLQDPIQSFFAKYVAQWNVVHTDQTKQLYFMAATLIPMGLSAVTSLLYMRNDPRRINSKLSKPNR